jgi:hypothetical protein
MRSVSSTRLRCAWTLWAVSGNPGIPGSTMGLATGTSAGLRAGHDVSRAPGSAALWGRAGRQLAPRPLDATLACHRRPTSTRRRPTTVSTGARRRHNGASVNRTLTEYSRATPHAPGGGHRATARALTENAACACGVRSIGRVYTTGCASGAGPTTAGAAAGRERMG